MSMNKLESRQQLLVITMEECGELIQECSKALRKQDLFEQQNLKDEIGDVYAMINLLVEHDVVSWTDLEDRVDYKKNKLGEKGKKVKENFEYTSDKNPDFLSIEKIKKINKKEGF